MNVDQLTKKRQLNVPEQNALQKQRILDVAQSFREDQPWTQWIRRILFDIGLDSSRGILAGCTSVACGDNAEISKAVWLTEDARFFSMEAITEMGSFALIEIESVNEISDQTSTKTHLRGEGKSFGCLALEVLREVTE